MSKWFGALVAVSDVSFDIGPGVTALLGPNGAGKSTMLRMLCGLARPSQGAVRILGKDPRSDASITRRIGLVPQQESVFETLTAREFVRLAATLHGLPEPDGAAAHALETVDLDPADTRKLPTYSKGMRQRVKVAQAIVHDPAVLVLDEPLTGLDPRQRVDMVGLFRRLGSEGRCVIVSSHVLDEVERLGSQILVMSQGRLAAAGDFHELRALMDDRPLRVRVRTDRPRELAGALLEVRHRSRCAAARRRRARARHERREGAHSRTRPGRTRQGSTPVRSQVPRRRPRRRLPLRGAAMSVASSAAGRQSVLARLVSLGALYRLLLRTQITVARVLGIAALSGLSMLLGLFSRWDSDPAQAAADATAAYGLALVVPLATLWLGTAAIGDLVEDRLLVYLWLKPVPRWQLPAAAILATASVLVPLTALPVAATALAAGAVEVAPAALLAASLAGPRLRRRVRRRRSLVPARSLVGARVRAPLGERRRAARRRLGAVHDRRVGEIRPRDGARHRRVALRRLRRGRVRRAPGGRRRRLAGRDVALHARRRRLNDGYARVSESKPAAARSASALSVRSHVKSRSSRPKWPYEAVFA